MTKQHILGLDVLRGLCALSVAAYHILSWDQYIDFSAVSRYSVYIFFILSGFSIHYQYNDKIRKLEDIRIFLTKRFIRLFPLLFLVVLLTNCAGLFNIDSHIRTYSMLVTSSLLFGFAAPAATSAVTGGWSLGIEFSFYIFYPVILSYCQSLRRYIFAMIILFLLKSMFIEFVFHAAYSNHWNVLFTNPLSFAFYFVVGCYIAEIYPHFQKLKNNPYVLCSLFPLFFLLFIPVNVDSKNILTGGLGFLFTLLSCGIVMAYSLFIPCHSTIKKASKFFGDISYGVYLLHPLVWKGFNILSILINFPLLRCIAILVITSVITFLFKKIFEDPLINFLKSKANFISV